jgi:transcriptional regulator with XRE-family HTH domain
MEVTTTTAKKKVAADRHPLAVAFGEYLKSIRKDSDKSQAELAFDASMDRTYISLLERGLSAPTLLGPATRNTSLTVLDSLAKALGMSMTDLMAGFEAQLPKNLRRTSVKRRINEASLAKTGLR